MKKIGIDARIYSTRATGIGRHALEVIKQLAVQDQTNQYKVYLREEEYDSFQVPGPNFTKIKTTAHHYTVAEQTTFWAQINKEAFDLMIFPQFNVPLLYNRPFIVTIHDLTIHMYPGKKSNPVKYFLYKKIIQNSASKSKAIMSVSHNTTKDIVSFLNIPEEKIHYVGNGISQTIKKPSETTIAKIKKQHSWPNQYLVYIGVFRTHKNIINLIKAFAIFHSNNPDVSLVLAGPNDPMYMPELKALAEELGVSDSIVWDGILSEEDLSALIAGSEGFVFPSFYEGFGIPPLEALQLGIVPAVSNTSSLPEACGECAVYFDPNNISEIAEAMTKIQNPEIKKAILSKAPKHISQFTWERVGESYWNVVKEVL